MAKERNAEESRNRIITAAEEIFADKGLDGARVDEIAAAAQINKRMIYHYFGGKEELYIEVMRNNYNKILETLHRANIRGNALNKVTQFIKNYFYFLAENEKFVRLIHWEALHGGRYSRQILTDISKAIMPELMQLLEEGVQEGSIRENLDIRHLIISINAINMMYFSRQDVFDFMWEQEQDVTAPKALEERLQHILDFTFNGILNHKAMEG
ncbi:TetR/AcrR family transcriptional regulator [Peptococcaceae bacterium 1198_IL3148]